MYPHAGGLVTGFPFEEVGILLHFFFMGTEVEIPDSHQKLVRPIVAQITKSELSIIIAVMIGIRLDWSFEQILVLSFMMMLNSIAVVSDYLKKQREHKCHWENLH